MGKVIVYGADWCGDTQRTLRQLDNLGVAYDYVNVEEDAEAARWVREQNEGKERKPTVKLGQQVLAEPNETELETALRENNLINQNTQK